MTKTAHPRSHTLQAESADIMNTWILTIRNRIDELLQTDHKRVDSFANAIPGAKKIRKMYAFSRVEPLMPINIDANKTSISCLNSDCEQFYKIAGNERCCDCGSADPKWASINLGITLCIACSGVHRSLGVHYSKVRSLTLDGWEPEIVKVMMELGNTVINAIYEANYVDEGTSPAAGDADAAPSSPVPKITRATFDCDISVRETWIKAKYIDKSFVIPLNELHLRSAILEETNCLSDIVFTDDGRWHIQRRRGNSITLREDKQSTNEDSASSSELSIDSNIVGDDSSVASSGSADDRDVETPANSAAESVANLSSDLLLYMAATIRHVPVMCYAIACGASQNWTNESDAYRTALHRAVLSVSEGECERGVVLRVMDFSIFRRNFRFILGFSCFFFFSIFVFFRISIFSGFRILLNFSSIFFSIFFDNTTASPAEHYFAHIPAEFRVVQRVPAAQRLQNQRGRREWLHIAAAGHAKRLHRPGVPPT